MAAKMNLYNIDGLEIPQNTSTPTDGKNILSTTFNIEEQLKKLGTDQARSDERVKFANSFTTKLRKGDVKGDSFRLTPSQLLDMSAVDQNATVNVLAMAMTTGFTKFFSRYANPELLPDALVPSMRLWLNGKGATPQAWFEVNAEAVKYLLEDGKMNMVGLEKPATGPGLDIREPVSRNKDTVYLMPGSDPRIVSELIKQGKGRSRNVELLDNNNYYYEELPDGKSVVRRQGANGGSGSKKDLSKLKHDAHGRLIG